MRILLRTDNQLQRWVLEILTKMSVSYVAAQYALSLSDTIKLHFFGMRTLSSSKISSRCHSFNITSHCTRTQETSKKCFAFGPKGHVVLR